MICKNWLKNNCLLFSNRKLCKQVQGKRVIHPEKREYHVCQRKRDRKWCNGVQISPTKHNAVHKDSRDFPQKVSGYWWFSGVHLDIDSGSRILYASDCQKAEVITRQMCTVEKKEPEETPYCHGNNWI